jgi:outer membrane lipoprotein-sorting protein
MNISRAAIFVTVLAAAVPGFAQTADDLVARNLAAKGGVELLKSTTSVRTTATGMMSGARVSVTTSTKRPYYMRQEMAMGDQKMVQGFDGQTLWMAAGGMPAQALPPGPRTDALKQTSQIDSPLLDYKAKGTRVELGDPLTVEGKRLHHLVVTPKSGPAMHYYLDPETYLESRMVMEVDESGQKSTMEMRFSDFKTIEGRTMPFTITQYVNGTRMGEMKFEKIEFDPPLDDAFFRMPK